MTGWWKVSELRLTDVFHWADHRLLIERIEENADHRHVKFLELGSDFRSGISLPLDTKVFVE